MRVLNVANAGSLVVGVLLMGLSSYVPLFCQTVLGTTAGRTYPSVGFRFTLTLGAVFAVAGALVLVTVDGHSSLLHLALACFVMGIGHPDLQRVCACVLEPAVHDVFVLSLVVALTLLVVGLCMPTRVVEA